jgi:hypothetical protein
MSTLTRTPQVARPEAAISAYGPARSTVKGSPLGRMPRYRVTGSSVLEALLDPQIARESHVYEFGVDPAHITSWQ